MLPALSGLSSPARPADGPLLAPGESVRALVLSTGEGGRALLLVKGVPLTARSEVGPLREGMTLQATVVLLDGRPALRLHDAAGAPPGAMAPADEPVARLLRLLLPAEASLGPPLDRLLAALLAAPGAGPAAELAALRSRLRLPDREPTAEEVKAALRTLGLQHEGELAERLLGAGGPPRGDGEPTLKAWLLERLSRLPPADRAAAEPSAAIDALLQSVERTQLLNVLSGQDDGPLSLELLLGWPGASSARLVIEEREAGGGPRAQPRRLGLTLLLTLDGLGPVRIAAELSGARVGARVLVEEAPVERLLAQRLPTLRAGLEAQGFEVAGLAAAVADRAAVAGADLPAVPLPDLGLVSLRA